MPKQERWQEHQYTNLLAPKRGHVHWVLEHKRKRKSGDYGKPEKWKLKQNVPPWIFKQLADSAKDLFNSTHSHDKTYHKEFPKIADALVRSGNTQGFEAKATRRDYGDVSWYLRGKPVATFMIADMSAHKQLWKPFDAAERLRKEKSGEGHRFRRMERKSKAPMRVIWAVSCNGRWFRLGIGKMRKQKKES